MIGGHAGGGSHIGTVDFGPAAAEYDENTVILEWYDYLFQGKQNDFATHPVKIFVMGENKWRFEDAWPLERARSTRYLLHSAGKANSSSGDGVLSATSAKSEKPDTFTYDPANPVPTVGGPLCCDPGHLPAGPRDQKEVEARPDVLVYSTPPLDSDIEVTGPVTLDLFAASSARRHRLHRKISRRLAQWLRAESDRRNPARPLSRINHRPSQTSRARQDLRIQNRSLVHQQRLPQRSHHPPRSLVEQLPALRPQPQHRQTRIDRLHLRQSHQHHLPRHLPSQRPYPPHRAAIRGRSHRVATLQAEALADCR